ncbi:MAG: hypothetical protein O3A53_18420 [Acidobacteria bacterium]|nr:hypothetical protein [Acidobacteriota bacterium]MDA1236763.1 hypothetical protein [Acidobacteriota bacterium]
MSTELERTIDSIVGDTVSSKLDTFAADLADRLHSECAALVDQIRKTDAPNPSVSYDKLLEGLRSIQKASSVVEVAGALVDSAAIFCGRAGLLINKGDSLLGFRLAGVGTEDKADAFQELSIALLEAAAFEQAVDSSGSVVASGSARDLSASLVDLLALRSEDRVGLFPVRLRSKVLAVLYCDSKGGAGSSAPLQSTAIEALISSAEGWIEAVSTRKR